MRWLMRLMEIKEEQLHLEKKKEIRDIMRNDILEVILEELKDENKNILAGEGLI